MSDDAPSSPPAADAPPAAVAPAFSPHRIDGLTDAIYGVAMTLLVIELKLPHQDAVLVPGRELLSELDELLPHFFAWIVSFFVLARFWLGHAQAHRHLQNADGGVWMRNMLQLATVCLMPFSCNLLGEHPGLVAQGVYSLNMVLMALAAMRTNRYLHLHPELFGAHSSMDAVRFATSQARLGLLMAVSLIAIAVQVLLPSAPGIGNVAFALMAFWAPLERWVQRRAVARTPPAANGH